jgi:ribonuclease VapC
MVVDSSAIIAVVFEEQDQRTYLDAMRSADLTMSAPTLLECRLVAYRRAGPMADAKLLTLIDALSIEIAAFDESLVSLAADAYRRFGKGRAALNFGDCFSYALARRLSEPLLYKGGNFARTDVAAAV